MNSPLITSIAIVSLNVTPLVSCAETLTDGEQFKSKLPVADVSILER